MFAAPAALLSSFILASPGVPTFDAPITIQFTNKHFPTQPAAADFDGDGQLDLVVPGRDSDGLVVVILRRPDGSFDASHLIFLGNGVQTDWAETADLDGDGFVDIALAVRATFGSICVLRGHGDGTFDPPVFFPTERETRCVRVADMDRDGKPDLVAMNYGSASIQVLANASTPGHVNFVPLAETRLNRWAVGQPFPNWAALADTNQDGYLDVIDFTAGSGRLNMRVNKGQGLGREQTWASPLVAGSPAGLTFGAVADLDRDGRPDVIAHPVTVNRSNPIVVWRGNAAGGFDAPQLFAGATTGTALNVAAADMDGDDDDDLIVTSVTGGEVSIVENRTVPGGPLNLAPPVPILNLDFPRHVVVFDFDHDGRPDLGVVDFQKHRLLLLRNAGVPPQANAGAAAGDSPAAAGTLIAARAAGTAAHPMAVSEFDDDDAASALAIALANLGPALPAGSVPAAQLDTAGDRRAELAPSQASCGPPAGDCSVVHAEPFCYTTPCCEIVCGFRPSCCESTWDADCVWIAASQCIGVVCPSRGSCTEPHVGGGCEDASCCALVTRLDPSCLYNWDSLCVELMTYACIGAAPTVTIPANAIDENEHCYETLSEGCSRRSNPAHVPVAPGEIRKGVVTGNGSRDVDAHLLTVTERQMVSLRLHAEFPAQLVLAQGDCDGPLVTYAEALAPAGGVCSIDRVLGPGQWRISVGMATPMQALRNGQPCMEEDPNHPWTEGPPTPGFFGTNWWMSIDAAEPPSVYDLDGSGSVDSGDVGLVLLSFGEIESDYDLDGSGQVDSGDVGLILLNFD